MTLLKSRAARRFSTASGLARRVSALLRGGLGLGFEVTIARGSSHAARLAPKFTAGALHATADGSAAIDGACDCDFASIAAAAAAAALRFRARWE